MPPRRRDPEFAAGWEPERPGRVLVRSQVERARLAVPPRIEGEAPGLGPPRISWSDAGVESHLVTVGSLLMDLQRLGRPSATSGEAVRLARKYGPLRVRRNGCPGRPGDRGALSGGDRTWDTAAGQALWASRWGEPLDWGLSEDHPRFPALLDEPAAWEPLAAWHCYGRVLRTMLDIAARLAAGDSVPMSMFADTWAPGSRHLYPLVVPADVKLAPRPEAFDPSQPACWAVSDYARDWWRVVSQAEGLTPQAALAWQLGGLAESAGLRLCLTWPDASRQPGGSPDLGPVYHMAPAPIATYPTAQTVRESQTEWSVWAVAVAQLHAAVASRRDWIECDECAVRFPIEARRRKPHAGHPAYCGDKCRLAGETRRRNLAHALRLVLRDTQSDRSFDRSTPPDAPNEGEHARAD